MGFLLALLCALAWAGSAHATTYGFDDFTRSVPLGPTWGHATYGGTWQEAFGSGRSVYSVDGSKGIIISGSSSVRGQTLPINQADVEISGDVGWDAIPSGGDLQQIVLARYVDDKNWYGLLVAESSGSTTVTCNIEKRVNGTITVIGGADTPAVSPYSAKTRINFKFRVQGTTLQSKCWPVGSSEPGWQQVSSASDLWAPASVGVRSVATGGLTSLNVSYDNWDAHSIGHVDPKIAAAGDIACRADASWFNKGLGTDLHCQQRWTSDLICGASAGSCSNPNGYSKVLALGDEQYACGEQTDWSGSWSHGGSGAYDSWRRIENVSGLLAPIMGNHETYNNSSGVDGCDHMNTWQPRGACYFKHFDGGTGNGDTTACSPNPTGIADPNGNAGYYSFNVGTWHIVALNSQNDCGQPAESTIPSCSKETSWLNSDLDANTRPCVLAYWHHPRYYSPISSNRPGVDTSSFEYDWWNVLVDHGADVILNGHNHDYERLAKLNEWGNPSARGVREFVVGTGGEDHEMGRDSAQPNSQAYQDTSFGVLELTLHPNSYEWNFRSARPSGSGAPWNPNYDDPAEGSVAQCNN